MEIRRLIGNEYLDKCYEIYQQKTKVSGTQTTPSKDKFLDHLENHFVENDFRYILGCFENNELISWIALTFINSKTRGQYWGITTLHTIRLHNVFSFSNPEIGLLIKEAFELAEQKGYFVYYYSIAEKVEKVYERQWRKNPWGFNGRYEFSIEATIPPMTQPADELYWRLLGKELKPDTVLIKKRILNKIEQQKLKDKYGY